MYKTGGISWIFTLKKICHCVGILVFSLSRYFIAMSSRTLAYLVRGTQKQNLMYIFENVTITIPHTGDTEPLLRCTDTRNNTNKIK